MAILNVFTIETPDVAGVSSDRRGETTLYAADFGKKALFDNNITIPLAIPEDVNRTQKVINVTDTTLTLIAASGVTITGQTTVPPYGVVDLVVLSATGSTTTWVASTNDLATKADAADIGIRTYASYTQAELDVLAVGTPVLAADLELYKLAADAKAEQLADAAGPTERVNTPATHGQWLQQLSPPHAFYYSTAIDPPNWVAWNGVAPIPPDAKIAPAAGVPSWVSVTAALLYVTPEQFGADGTVENDTQALLQCQSQGKPIHINGHYKCNQSLRLVDHAKWLGTGSIEFNDCGFFNDVDQQAEHWTIGEISLKRIGPPGPVISLEWGARRFNLIGTRITGSNGTGCLIRGGRKGRWTHGYIKDCSGHGLEMVEGQGTINGLLGPTGVGMKDFVFSGEIKSSGLNTSKAGVYMELCEGIDLSQCSVDGNNRNIEFGTNNKSITLPYNFEASSLAGQVITNSTVTQPCNNVVLRTGSTVRNKTTASGSPVNSFSALKIRDVESLTVEPGVYFDGMATLTEPMIMLSETVTSRATGSVSDVRHDAPYGYVLRNNTERFGSPQKNTTSIVSTLTATGISDVIVPVDASEFASRVIDLDVAVNCSAAGVATFTVNAFDSQGVIMFNGAPSSSLVHVSQGVQIVRIKCPVRAAETFYGSALIDVPRSVRIRRNGDGAADTAGDLTLISVTTTVYDNLIKNKGFARLSDLVLPAPADRRPFIQMSVSPTMGSALGSKPGNMVNGNVTDVNATGAWIPNAVSAAGEWINFHIRGEGGAVLKGFDTITSTTLGGQWLIEASNDKVTWTTIHPDRDFTASRSWIINGNNTAYKNYRFLGISGTTSQDCKINSIIPRIV